MTQLANDPISQEAGLGLARAIVLHGLRTPSLKEIAEALGASVPTVHRWLGGGQRNLPCAVGAHLGAILDAMRDRMGGRGAAGFIPRGDYEMFAIRAFLAFEELGRSDEDVAEQVAEAWRVLRVLLGNALRRPDVEREVVILRGLWASVCDGDTAMSLDDASRIWAEELRL